MMEERILCVKDMVEKMDAVFKEKMKSKNVPKIKYPGNVEHYKNTISRNNRN